MADPVPGIVEQAGKRGEGQTSGLFSIQGSKRQSIRNTTLSSASSQPSALRVSVASADPAMGDILEESLVSAGMVVTRIAVGPSLGPGQVHGQARDGAPHMPPPMPSQAAPQVVVVQLDGPLGPEGHSGLPGLAETHPLTPLVLVDGFGRWAQVGMNRTVLANQAPGRLTGRPTAGPLTGGMSALNMGPPGGRTAAGVASPEANPEASPGAGPGPGRRTEVVPAPFRVEALIEAVRRCVGSLGNVPDNPSTGRSSGAAAGSPGH